MFLDNQHRLLAYEELFRSTLGSASIFALQLNCGAIIVVHNHPSGDQSRATQTGSLLRPSERP
ncbi:JAB domain-containing protein [Aeromonas caviae]|uniref:JAB domain-containing protein n=1 Tax=Aeromonas caviae TaxID=648 RepID=UPI0039778B75